MNPVIKFFNAIDNFLSKCVDYFDSRVRTGKFIDDINYFVNLVVNFCAENGKKFSTAVFKPGILTAIINSLRSIRQLFMRIMPLKVGISFIIDTIKILITCYAEIFIVFSFTFPTTILLLNWFQTSIIAFFVGLIPILLLNIYCVSSLYLFIRKKEEGEKVSIWHCFHILIPRFSSFISPTLTQLSVIQESFLGFIILSLFLSYAFDLIHMSWGNSFIYWFTVLFIGFIIILGIFVLSIIMHQTYFAILLDNLSFRQAFKRSAANVSSYFPYYFFFYLILYLVLGSIIFKLSVSYIYLGLGIGLYGASIITLFMGFLLWKKFPAQRVEEIGAAQTGPPILLVIIVFFGFMNYILFAVFMVKEYQPLISFVQQQENNYLASQEMKRYTNRVYNYTIQYPQAWTVYEWNDKSTTFYSNYTGTVTGGTWMSINVSSYNQQAFDQLFASPPGLVIEDGVTKNVTTKITNMNVQGNDAVNYTFIKQVQPYPQFETHYLIHNEDLMYDIAFISVANDVASYNSDLFTKIITSFQFTK